MYYYLTIQNVVASGASESGVKALRNLHSVGIVFLLKIIKLRFCEISTVYLSYVVPVKSTVEISQNFVAFSEYMNFIFEKYDTEHVAK